MVQISSIDNQRNEGYFHIPLVYYIQIRLVDNTFNQIAWPFLLWSFEYIGLLNSQLSNPLYLALIVNIMETIFKKSEWEFTSTLTTYNNENKYFVTLISKLSNKNAKKTENLWDISLKYDVNAYCTI